MSKSKTKKILKKKAVKTKVSRPKGKAIKGRRIKLFTAAQLAKSSELVKGNKHITAGQAREKRDLLLRLRERITGQINFLATDNLSRSEKDNEVNFRSEEQGTDNFDRDFALNRVSLDQELMFEVDEALNRLAQGTYGICDVCGRGVEKARLKALPYSRMCIACQSQSEGSKKKIRSFESEGVFHAAEKNTAEAAAEEE